MKDMIHEALQGGGGITQAKGHDQKLIMALMSSKGSQKILFLTLVAEKYLSSQL
jgi:hypothetical protein